MKQIGFIGAGAMAEALISGLVAQEVQPKQVIASDISAQRRKLIEEEYQITVTADNKEVVAESDYVILAVKPQVLEQVMTEIEHLFTSEQKLISIAAGVSIAQLEELLTIKLPIVRIMPNTPALVKEGALAYALGEDADDKLGAEIEDLFSAVGSVVQVKEELMSAVTGLSGSGPAYVLLLLEGLIAGGVKEGLAHSEAEELAIQTLKGTAKLAAESEQHLAALRDQVTSPGGTTAEGLYQLESQGARAALIDAVVASAKKADQM
ncbi:MAG: pyrroline-5-carboxylate reductase [Bacillota bacterium]